MMVGHGLRLKNTTKAIWMTREIPTIVKKSFVPGFLGKAILMLLLLTFEKSKEFHSDRGKCSVTMINDIDLSHHRFHTLDIDSKKEALVQFLVYGSFREKGKTQSGFHPSFD
jgi:hypothetical protein